MPIDWSGGKAPAGRVIDDPVMEKVKDEVADEIFTAAGSQYQGPKVDDDGKVVKVEKATSDREDIERTIYKFQLDFGAAITERLGPQGIHCSRIGISGNRDGFNIDCRDTEGRLFEVFMGWDEHIDAAARYDSPGREMLRIVCDRVVEARKRYFERMH